MKWTNNDGEIVDNLSCCDFVEENDTNMFIITHLNSFQSVVQPFILTILSLFYSKMILYNARSGKRIPFYGNCKNSNIPENVRKFFFSWLDLPLLWRLKSPTYEFLELAIRFFLAFY